MSTNTKSINNPKYSIDMSIEKYKTRYDRLLNILFYSKELPSDLYIMMNMSHVNYRKTISILKQRNIIDTLKRDDTTGYILTTTGKKLTKQLSYMRYKECLEDERKYDITHRNRKRQFAYLYALLDRIGIPYESFLKPPINEVTIQDNKVYFYTALDFKRLIGVEATTFMGSRLLGFFIGKGQIIPVYRTNQMLKTFGSHEGLIPDIMKQHFTTPVDTAILICEDRNAVTDITMQIFQNRSNNPKEGINTALYKKFYVFPSDDTFLSHISDLYENNNKIEQYIINKYNVNTSDKDDKGRLRVNLGTGYIGDSPIYICVDNINVVQAKVFIREAELNHKTNYIVCQERDRDYILSITKNIPIKILLLKKERVDK